MGEPSEGAAEIGFLYVASYEIIVVPGEVIHRKRRKNGIDQTATEVIARSRSVEETVDSGISEHTSVSVIGVFSSAGCDREWGGEYYWATDITPAQVRILLLQLGGYA